MFRILGIGILPETRQERSTYLRAEVEDYGDDDVAVDTTEQQELRGVCCSCFSGWPLVGMRESTFTLVYWG